ncbi:hypothetical protein ACLMJK_007526 [Lecanora helva]
MAFVFSSLSKPKDGHPKVDIVCVPAIGADPRRTWARQIDSAGHEHDRLDYTVHDKLYPNAQVHLYDHYTPQERRLEIKQAQGPNDQAHRQSAEALAAAENALSGYGFVKWAEHFQRVIQDHRHAHGTDRRPVIFICHSTGGIVVKQALSQKPAESEHDLIAACIGVTFFACPHHGSSVLSGPEYVQTVRDHLELKWEMSEALRNDLSLRNTDLETLNYRFAVRAVGIKIYSYVETKDTNLTVLSTGDIGGETLTAIRLCIVDSRSGKLKTPEVPIEDEEVISLNTTHIGAPRFTGEDTLYTYYIEELAAFVKDFSAEDRAAYHDLNNDIMTRIEVDIHQFYDFSAQNGPGSMKIFSANPNLRKFLDVGPKQCMEERRQGMEGIDEYQSDGSIRPSIALRPATEPSEPTAPSLTITTADVEVSLNNKSKLASEQKLEIPSVAPPKSIHTKRPAMGVALEVPDSVDHLKSKPARAVQFGDTPKQDNASIDVDDRRRPQRKRLFPLPNISSERFKWIHIPCTNAGWVPHVLTTISREKEDLGLHARVLMDKVWFSQHNRSRHGSPHARFVRAGIKCLLPKDVERSHTDGIKTPSSAIDDTQFVVYLPYLHWDSFKSLQKRADIIRRRREQAHARPVAKDVASGRSMEHKLIWQYLTSDRPLHCRRTLDQYGYPSLRNTTVRDADQILYKRTKADVDGGPVKESNIRHKHRPFLGRQSVASGYSVDSNDGSLKSGDQAKVLMVDQMWLWIIDRNTVITFFSPKEKEDGDHGTSREGDLRSEIYQDINGDYASQCVDPYDFAGLAVFHAIKALLDKTNDRNLQVFRIFEEYISILTEQQTSSFKHFRNNHKFEIAKDINAQQHIDNQNDLDSLLELRDIEDELNTIGKLIKEQQGCVSDMIFQYEHLIKEHSKGHNGINFLADVQSFLNEHQDQVDSMLKGAKAAQTAFKELLDMKQKQANIVESHLAREQTEVAADQSRSVMIFTIFTIIFLPLSFFASVFGINSKEWTGGNYPHLHTIFTYMGSISIAVIVIALLVAFNKYTRRLALKSWKLIGAPFVTPLRRCGLLGRPSEQISGSNVLVIDLEKANKVDLERAEGVKRLETISRSYSKMNWEDELKLHRNSMFGI